MDMPIHLQRYVNKLRSLIPELKESYQVESLGIFGSFVRNQQHLDSDLDILVTYIEPPTLFKFIELENYLSDQLGVKVDLVMKDSLKLGIRKNVLQEVTQI